MDTEILEDLGLSHAEAKVYLALLGQGASKTGRIIDSTKMQSSTVYHVLGSLVEKGLVSYIQKGKVKYYQAEHPESFLAFLEEKKRRFNEILPRLKEHEKLSSQKQTARVYEGIKGLKTAFNDILSSLKRGDEYYFFQSPKQALFNKKVVLFFRNYHLKRAEKGISVKGLATKDSANIVFQIFKGISHTKIKYLDEFTPNGVIIYKNKVITLDWDNIPTAFVIESNAVSESYKQFFLQKWKKS